jgi:peptidyl-tRNA hydrolase, PTH1 family
MAQKVQAIDNQARTGDLENHLENYLENHEPERARVYCVVGLGNPGTRYENTPHNLGFLVIDRLAERNGMKVRSNEGVTLTGKGQVGGRDVVLAKPLTFMNRSGMSVKTLLQSRRLTNRDLIVVYDDIDLPWMALRIKKKGSSGGHNGMKSIIAEVGTDWFARVRVGIHPGHEVEDTATYDLAPFERGLKEGLDEMLSYAAEAVESIIADGAIQAMTKFNRRAKRLKDEEE